MYADEVAGVALKYDSNNVRALFIRGLLGPIVNSKGILARIKPVISKTEQGRVEYARMVEDSQKWPNHSLKTFLFDGKADLKTETDVQNYFGDTEKKYEEFRKLLTEIRSSTLTLNIPDNWQEETIARKAKSCEAEKVAEGQYEVNCDLSSALEVKLNVADFDSIKHIVAGMEIYQILTNSYSYQGAIQTAEDFKGSRPEATTVYNALLRDQEFGKVRSASSLKKIVAMGLDGIAGLRWFQANQPEVCPNGEDQLNRAGFLIERGICVKSDNHKVSETDTLGSVIRTIELALRGGTIVETFRNTNSNQEIVSEIRPAAPLLNPIQDLRNLGLQFDSCNQLSAVKDSTFGGFFVNRDANAIIQVTKSNCWKNR